MRVRQPEPFDPNREYRPGERCVYRGMVLIAEIWTAADARLANNNPAIFRQRCVRCKIKREDRPGMFGNKGNERGNGIHQPPWNATLFSLLKWEIRKRYRTIGNKPRKTKPEFCRLYT